MWLPGLALVVAAYVPVILLARIPGAWSHIPWLVAPFLAVAGWVNAARRVDRRAHLAAWVFACAAALGLVTQVVWAVEVYVLGGSSLPLAAYLFLLPYVLLGAGAWLALGSRRPWSPGMTADAVLVLLAALVAVLRLVVEPVIASSAGSGERALIVSLQVLGLPPLFVASLLMLRRRSALSPASAVALFGATLVLFGSGVARELFQTAAQGVIVGPARVLQAQGDIVLGGGLRLANGGHIDRDQLGEIGRKAGGRESPSISSREQRADLRLPTRAMIRRRTTLDQGSTGEVFWGGTTHGADRPCLRPDGISCICSSMFLTVRYLTWELCE